MPAIQRPIRTRDDFARAFGSRPVPVADALRAGFTRGGLDAAVRRGLLVRPRHGVVSLAPPADVPDLTGFDDGAHHAREQRLTAMRAALAVVRDDVLVAGAAAAAVHDLPLPPGAASSAVELVRPDGSGYAGAATRRRGSPIPLQDRTVVDGVAVTTVERTAVELARGHRLPQALVPLDAAARAIVARETASSGNELRRWCQHEALIEVARGRLAASLANLHGWAGTVRVREALGWVHPAAESPFESRSRGWFVEAGLGPSNPGRPVVVGTTTYWADFCDPEAGVVGEADGWSKYGRTADEVRARLAQEKARAAALESAGWRVVRWTTSDPRRAVVSRWRSARTPTAR